ncbi:hypothetical protein AURDEDRAFT_167629 [Auricularia subglabra TFB-10046 SS5]|nr:hypothetical protein AURDEDRAFT_167629 [Auricularia subglabra TFB-10046 SS5]
MERPPSVQLPSLVPTYGMMEIGSVVAIFLSGIATLQTWNYFRNYWGDPVVTRLLVASIYVMDTIHSATLVAAIYQYTIRNFGDYAALVSWIWELRLSIILNGVIAFVVQTYFCDRVRRVRQGYVLAGVCWSLSVARFAFNILMSRTISTHPVATTLLLPRFKWQITATLIVGAASDVAIAACICERLIHMRGQGFRETDRVLDRLVAFTVASGLLTSVAAVIEAILYLKLTHSYAFLIPYAAVAKLFNNSLLAWLNDRNNARRSAVSVKPSKGSSGEGTATANTELDMFNSKKQFETTVDGRTFEV